MECKTLIGFGIGLLTGAVVGGGVALLYAPNSGKKTRKLIKDSATDFADEVVDTVKEETAQVIDTVEDAVSGVERKGKAVVKAMKD
jgi:gas vesicle protein